MSCVLQDSNVFEKAGVNVSAVNGYLSEQAAAQVKLFRQSIGLRVFFINLISSN